MESAGVTRDFRTRILVSRRVCMKATCGAVMIWLTPFESMIKLVSAIFQKNSTHPLTYDREIDKV
eukprot:UN21652